MSYTIDLDLDPIIVEALEKIGKSDTLDANICEVLIHYIKIRLNKLYKKNLRMQQKFIADQVKNKKIVIDNLNLESILLTSKQEKFKTEENMLLELYNTLKLFRKGKLTENDMERFEEKILAQNKKTKEEKYISRLKQQQPQREFHTLPNLIIVRNNSEFRDHEDSSILEGKESLYVTTEKILEVLSNKWQNIKELILYMKIKDMMDARFLQVKLINLERKNLIEMKVIMGKKHWRLK